jgi:hypothetical protein
MDTETKKMQMELFNNFISDSKSVPHFISGRKFTHKKCFDISQDLFYYLRKLYSDEILSESEIKNLYYDMINCINEMLDVDSGIGLEYYRYTMELCLFYLSIAVENELYETAENLTKFINLYEKRKNN